MNGKYEETFFKASKVFQSVRFLFTGGKFVSSHNSEVSFCGRICFFFVNAKKYRSKEFCSISSSNNSFLKKRCKGLNKRSARVRFGDVFNLYIQSPERGLS